MAIKFDTTINLGHVISLITFLGAAVVAWSTLDKRVVELEVKSRWQDARDAAQDAYMRETVADIKRGIERIADRMDKTNRQEAP